jgi:GTPase Era involved in 16S rRNA processing
MDINNRTAQDKLVHILEVITGLSLCEENVIPSVSLITALGIALVKINSVSKSNEKQYLQEHLYNFSNIFSLTRQLTDLIIEYIHESEIETINNKFTVIEQYLTKSQKFLLITYIHSVSTINNQKNIKDIAELLKIQNTYLQTIESIFFEKNNCNLEASKVVKELLNPVNFEYLDIAVSNVAKDMLAVLENTPEQQKEIETTATSYEYLRQYQQSCKQLNNYCYELHQIMDEYHENNLIPDTFLTQISAISHQLQSPSFRVAVVGEFSQGKSTLLNALLKEEIQPVRAIPCSGTVTILKYGQQKRVICRYKDGREEEIPLEQYHEKAAISEAAALDGVSDELTTSQIKEIVFEHPNLELCRHGVEIVDSPGLNEHPERSAITEQLIKDTDAVIFLTNASRLLTQGERELISELKTKLNDGDNSKAAGNLFIVVNFMDLLRQETDRASVKERIERFAYNNNPIITGDNRIHFISAQAALDAIKEGYEDKYLNSFNSLTESIETFLTSEIGSIKLNQNVNKVKDLILSFQEQQQEDKQDVLEQIGVVSSWDVELYQYVIYLKEEAINETIDSWNEWVEELADRIYQESETWTSTHEDQTKILKFFSEKFHNALINELNNWLKHIIQKSILKSKLELIDSEIESIIEALEDLFENFDNQVGVNIKHQLESFISQQQISLNINISNIDDNNGNGVGFGLGLSGAGLVGLGLLAFTGIGLIPITLTALGSGFGLGALFGESKQDKIKRIILEKGFEQFYESQQETFDKISEEITLVFENKIKLSSQIIKEAILILENLIERQDNLSQNQQKISNISSKINALMVQSK